MKYTIIICSILFVFNCQEKHYSETLNGDTILQQSVAAHDSSNSWKNSVLKIHIQEPRLLNPHRYSILTLNNNNNYFELSRNRGTHISKHILDETGKSTVLLDNKTVTDSTLIKKYRLNPERNTGYKNFYKTMYGLPMSLNTGAISEIKSVEKIKFNNENCFKIALELKEPIISKFWNLYISEKTYLIKGLDIIFPDAPKKGDRIYFDGSIQIGSIKIPRFRHWHELHNNSYSGSDIIVK